MEEPWICSYIVVGSLQSWVPQESMNVRLIRDLEKVMSPFCCLTQDMAEPFDSHWTVIVWNVGGRKKYPCMAGGGCLCCDPSFPLTGVLQQTAIVWRDDCGRRCRDRSPPCGPGSLQPLLLCDVHRYEGQMINAYLWDCSPNWGMLRVVVWVGEEREVSTLRSFYVPDSLLWTMEVQGIVMDS